MVYQWHFLKPGKKNLLEESVITIIPGSRPGTTLDIVYTELFREDLRVEPSSTTLPINVLSLARSLARAFFFSRSQSYHVLSPIKKWNVLHPRITVANLSSTLAWLQIHWTAIVMIRLFYTYHSVLQPQHLCSFWMPFKHRYTQTKCFCHVILNDWLQLFMVANQNYLSSSWARNRHEWFRLHAHAAFIHNTLLDIITRGSYPGTTRCCACAKDNLCSRLLKSPVLRTSDKLKERKRKRWRKLKKVTVRIFVTFLL